MSAPEKPQFTPEAARKWAELGDRLQTSILDNVWCVKCRKPTTIVRFTGRMEQGDLVLEGRCIRCDGSVARLVEGD